MEQKAGARVALSGPTRRIGTATLMVRKTLQDEGYPTASWYRKVKCEPQTVALRSDGYWAYFVFRGVVAQSHLPSSLLGATSDNPQDARAVGTAGPKYHQVYVYDLAAWIGGAAAGPADVTFALDEGYAAVSSTGPTADGGTRTAWSLTMPSDGHPLKVDWRGGERDPDPTKWTISWQRYGVTYRGEDRGEVRVRTRASSDDDAMRAAEELVFGGQAGG